MTVRYKARDGVVFCQVEDGVALLDTEENKYFSLNSTGALVWENLFLSNSLDGLCEELAKVYDISSDRCRPDVGRLLEDLAKSGLVEIVSQDDGKPSSERI